MMMEMRLLWLHVGVLRNVSLETTVDVSLQVRTCNTSAEKILLSISNMGFMAPKKCAVLEYMSGITIFLCFNLISVHDCCNEMCVTVFDVCVNFTQFSRG
jgi:hypothetical protein